MHRGSRVTYLRVLLLLGFLVADVTWAAPGNATPTPKGKASTPTSTSKTPTRSTAGSKKPAVTKAAAAKTPSKVLKAAPKPSAKAPLITTKKKPVTGRPAEATVGKSKPKSAASKTATANPPKKPATTRSEPKTSQAKTSPARPVKTGLKEESTVKRNAVKKTSAPPSSGSEDVVDSDEETNWLFWGLGIFVAALGSGGFFWYRSQKKPADLDPAVDLQSDDPAVSTFVSNVTAFELDGQGNRGAETDRRGKGQSGKNGRERSSDRLSLTQADHQMMQDTPQAATGNKQKIATSDPPASKSPAQIVVPKKTKPPVAS